MNAKEKHLHLILFDEHLAELIDFYNPYFENRNSCIDFLYEILQYEPPHAPKFINDGIYYVDFDNKILPDEAFIPKRMLNAVQRFVSVCRELETSRPGDDPFKIIYYITCIESLQTLGGANTKPKKHMVLDFFTSYISEEDHAFISNHFEGIPNDLFAPSKSGPEVMAEALYSIRNAAVHNGECWDSIFPTDGFRLIITVPEKKTKFKGYVNGVCYEKFEKIFVRTSINFVRQYVHRKHQ